MRNDDIYPDGDLPRERMTGVFPISADEAVKISVRRKLDRATNLLRDIRLAAIVGVSQLVILVLMELAR